MGCFSKLNIPFPPIPRIPVPPYRIYNSPPAAVMSLEVRLSAVSCYATCPRCRPCTRADRRGRGQGRTAGGGDRGGPQGAGTGADINQAFGSCISSPGRMSTTQPTGSQCIQGSGIEKYHEII